MFDTGKIQASVVAAVAALVLTAGTVGVAAGPARAAETEKPVYAALELAADANA
jgi:hypothetical protein